MTINLIDIVQHVLNVVVLFVILRALVYKPVREFMKNREERLEKQHEDVKNEMDNVMKMKSQYEASLENAKAEAENTVREGVLHADKAAKEIIEKAEQEAKTLIKEAREQSLREKHEAMNALRSEVTNLAVELASKILEREISLDDNKKIIDKYFSKVG